MSDRRLQKIKRTVYTTIVFVAFICVCATLMYRTQELKKQETKVNVQLERAKTNYEKEQDRAEDIEQYKAYVQTNKYAEEVARDKFGMVYKDEVIFTPEYDE